MKVKTTPKRGMTLVRQSSSLRNRTCSLLEDLNQYILYLEKRIETQDNLIMSLQNNIEAYASFIQDLHVTHKSTPNFGNNNIEVITIDE